MITALGLGAWWTNTYADAGPLARPAGLCCPRSVVLALGALNHLGLGDQRSWPLLTGERAHYELAAGHLAEAQRLRQAMAAIANAGGMLPEQAWDAPDLPDKELFFGQAFGSAMPLVWAHAEYVKLCRSLAEKRVFDLPPQLVQRYQVERVKSPYSYSSSGGSLAEAKIEASRLG